MEDKYESLSLEQRIRCLEMFIVFSDNGENTPFDNNNYKAFLKSFLNIDYNFSTSTGRFATDD